jgi:hypothetical protein
MGIKISDRHKVSVAIAITLAFFLAELAGECCLKEIQDFKYTN